jgi:hypothetical protein
MRARSPHVLGVLGSPLAGQGLDLNPQRQTAENGLGTIGWPRRILMGDLRTGGGWTGDEASCRRCAYKRLSLGSPPDPWVRPKHRYPRTEYREKRSEAGSLSADGLVGQFANPPVRNGHGASMRVPHHAPLRSARP